MVVRETPFSTIQLNNMHQLSLAGAVILPASPGFYHQPSTVEEMVDFVVARVIDQLGLEHSISKRWKNE
jgi:4-hydroxy-3-polyprenylbenzoate decarboxylase